MAKKITQVTVKEMYQALGKAIKEGDGDKYLVCASDIEGNSYYGVFCHLTPMPAYCIDFLSDSQIMDHNKLMIIG